MSRFGKHIKNAISKNLSLSSKLFLRGLYRSSTNTANKVVRFPGNLAKRVINSAAARLGSDYSVGTQTYSWETPSLEVFDPASHGNLSLRRLAKGSAAVIKTSIIIPVFNKAEFTLQCLRSLIDEIDFSENEIILVDNASTDETSRVLAHFETVVRVIRNEENRGFVDACNQGAAAASGKYLVFLNNDTRVLPGWLDNLLETIAANPANGAVGSMFLYPDGSIQEAGSIVWKSGEAHHYGWGGSPDDRRFNFAREVDYCSAASLLIRENLFDKLGGFDRRFAPAYYEDVDLCFGVRSLGYKVRYQPLSRVIHYEGVTAGSDTRKGLKQFQIINREKFIAKWREVLEREHLPKAVERLTEASSRQRDWPGIIVFDERIPSPDRDAGSLRMFLILKMLAAWCRVVFVPFNRPQSADYESALWKEGIETADAVDYRRLLKNKKVAAAIISRPSMAGVFIPRIRRTNPRVKIIFDTVDLHFVRFQREYEINGDPKALANAQRYRKLERDFAQASDLVWCASTEDKEVMMREVPERQIALVPTIHELRDAGETFAARKDLLFIGNLAHRPNEDAVLFFMQEVYPQIRQLLPNVRLDIIGDNPSVDIAAFASDEVRVRGYVPDVAPYLRERRVFVAPLRFGAGIKGKVGEAMAHGIPVVTTSVGAEGFGLRHGVDVMIADDPASFATSVAQLSSQQELWERIARNARMRIEKHFTPDVIRVAINSSLRESFTDQASGGKPPFPTSS